MRGKSCSGSEAVLVVVAAVVAAAVVVVAVVVVVLVDEARSWLWSQSLTQIQEQT